MKTEDLLGEFIKATPDLGEYMSPKLQELQTEAWKAWVAKNEIPPVEFNLPHWFNHHMYTILLSVVCFACTIAFFHWNEQEATTMMNQVMYCVLYVAFVNTFVLTFKGFKFHVEEILSSHPVALAVFIGIVCLGFAVVIRSN
jgi:magnesium-transporting ATPase (P-type)